MVFFDFDRSNITAQAAATIKQAADTAKSAGTATGRTSNDCAAEARRRGIEGEALTKFVGECTGGAAITRIGVTGHTDTSGAATYNMALSLRRANAVKDALVREGIPAAAIAVTGRGETQLLVQTQDGVKEPQNRRVEIVLQ
jgi:outer membrane protein OmpA-like peptidoglycan-associated protein